MIIVLFVEGIEMEVEVEKVKEVKKKEGNLQYFQRISN